MLDDAHDEDIDVVAYVDCVANKLWVLNNDWVEKLDAYELDANNELVAIMDWVLNCAWIALVIDPNNTLAVPANDADNL